MRRAWERWDVGFGPGTTPSRWFVSPRQLEKKKGNVAIVSVVMAGWNFGRELNNGRASTLENISSSSYVWATSSRPAPIRPPSYLASEARVFSSVSAVWLYGVASRSAPSLWKL